MPAPASRVTRGAAFVAAHAELIMFAIALIWLAGSAAGGSWLAPSEREIVAVRLDRTAFAPLYDLLAGGFVRLPLGDPAFRLGLLAAVLGATTLAGLVAASRALVKQPLPGAIAAVLLAIAPPVREAMGTAQPGMLAAAGLVWVVALLLAPHDRARAIRATVAAIAVIGAAPWLGAVIAIVVVVELDRRARPAAIGAIGGAAVLLWIGAIGTVPLLDPDLAAVVGASGRGSAALVVGIGLLGVLFGAATGLPRARLVAIVVLAATVDAIAIDHDALALISILAIGTPIVLRAISRALPTTPAWIVALGAGLPIVGVAAVLGAEVRLDDAGAAPARLAADLIDELPAGPGLVIATRAPGFVAIDREQQIAGSRPDLVLVPPAQQTDTLVANALRDGTFVIGADVAAFGRLDPRRALPSGRGYALLDTDVVGHIPLPDRATYASELGRDQALRIDLARAAYEAANGRLDAAARAIGLADRFGAADLAVLAATLPTRARPPLYAHIPPEARTTDELDLFRDDLAWVADLPAVELPPSAPAGRKLHAAWRAAIEAGATPESLWSATEKKDRR